MRTWMYRSASCTRTSRTAGAIILAQRGVVQLAHVGRLDDGTHVARREGAHEGDGEWLGACGVGDGLDAPPVGGVHEQAEQQQAHAVTARHGKLHVAWWVAMLRRSKVAERKGADDEECAVGDAGAA